MKHNDDFTAYMLTALILIVILAGFAGTYQKINTARDQCVEVKSNASL